MTSKLHKHTCNRESPSVFPEYRPWLTKLQPSPPPKVLRRKAFLSPGGKSIPHAGRLRRGVKASSSHYMDE